MTAGSEIRNNSSKPVLLTIDDDAAVLRAVERDLRKRYADRYRVMRADSGMAALDLIRQLQLRNETVALFLCDQRMPGMTGVEYLERAKAIYPDARRVLLTAYSDTQAAIDSINRVQINHYLLKPWDPPEQNLYPVLDDLLEDWQATYHPPFEGVRVVGAGGRRRPTPSRIFLRATRSRTRGSTSSRRIMIRMHSA